MRKTFLENDQELERICRLNKIIQETYGDLAPDEVDILVRDFDRSVTTMIEARDLRLSSAFFIGAMDDVEFKPVLIPPALFSEIRIGDVFLATLGSRNGRWEIIWLSPAYEALDTVLE